MKTPEERMEETAREIIDEILQEEKILAELKRVVFYFRQEIVEDSEISGADFLGEIGECLELCKNLWLKEDVKRHEEEQEEEDRRDHKHGLYGDTSD